MGKFWWLLLAALLLGAYLVVPDGRWWFYTRQVLDMLQGQAADFARSIWLP